LQLLVWCDCNLCEEVEPFADEPFTEKEGGGGEVKRFCRERAGGTKTCGRDEYGLGGAVGLDLARRFSLRAFSCNI
jgi:hypothetical protein